MARTRSSVLTPAETEIMKVLWDLGPSSVATVTHRVHGRRHYNTVLTILRILEHKGYVKHARVPKQRGFVYQPRVTRGKATKMFVKDLVDRMYGGKIDALMANLVAEKGISPAETRRLRAVLSGKRR